MATRNRQAPKLQKQAFPNVTRNPDFGYGGAQSAKYTVSLCGQVLPSRTTREQYWLSFPRQTREYQTAVTARNCTSWGCHAPDALSNPSYWIFNQKISKRPKKRKWISWRLRLGLRDCSSIKLSCGQPTSIVCSLHLKNLFGACLHLKELLRCESLWARSLLSSIVIQRILRMATHLTNLMRCCPSQWLEAVSLRGESSNIIIQKVR